MKQRWLIVFLTAIVTVALSACAANEQNNTNNKSGDKVKVTTTIGMIKDIASEVGGEYVEVIGLMPSGVDPHLYKATQGDIKKLDDAEIIFYNGLHLEGKMAEILEQMSKKKPVFAVSESIPLDRLRHGNEQLQTEYDPHIWFDVELWMMATETVRDRLIEFDPDHEANYRAQTDSYLAKLVQLNEFAKEQIASIPQETRVLVTAHDAFGYFGDAYGIEVMGLQGISTASEAGTRDVTELRDLLVERKIKAVFIESSVSPKYIEAVIQGAKELGHTIIIGGELFSDAMGAEGTAEGTYIGMVEHNVHTIANALK
jgi:manganese/zinc/iron transport system substrate-binding protein